MFTGDKAAKLRQSRMALVVALFSAVLFVFAYILQAWRYSQYWPFLPLFAGTFVLFTGLFVSKAPLCSSCRRRPWTIFSRTAICCFAEKVSLRRAVTRSLKVIAVLYVLGGVVIIYIRPIWAYGLLATEYAEQKMRRPALERFLREESEIKTRLGADPKNLDARLELGWLYYRANKTPLASAEYAQALKDHPDNPQALLLSAIMLGEMRQSLQEEKTYEKLLELQPENTEALVNLGLVYLRNKLTDRAVEKLDAARVVLEREKKRLERMTKTDESDAAPPPEADVKDLAAIRTHLSMVYYHLAIAMHLKKEVVKSGRYLKWAKDLGLPGDRFRDDVQRFGG